MRAAAHCESELGTMVEDDGGFRTGTGSMATWRSSRRTWGYNLAGHSGGNEFIDRLFGKHAPRFLCAAADVDLLNGAIVNEAVKRI
jgi:hypothetical protein